MPDKQPKLAKARLARATAQQCASGRSTRCTLTLTERSQQRSLRRHARKQNHAQDQDAAHAGQHPAKSHCKRRRRSATKQDKTTDKADGGECRRAGTRVPRPRKGRERTKRRTSVSANDSKLIPAAPTKKRGQRARAGRQQHGPSGLHGRGMRRRPASPACLCDSNVTDYVGGGQPEDAAEHPFHGPANRRIRGKRRGQIGSGTETPKSIFTSLSQCRARMRLQEASGTHNVSPD